MPEFGEKTSEQLFREALREAVEHPQRDVLLSGLLSAASLMPTLAAVAEEELAPVAAELELHLEEGDVADHATNARSFGVFVTSMSEAAKEYAKSALRLGAMSSPLRVAPGPGSVRATFIAPMPHARDDSVHTPLSAKSAVDDPIWTESDVFSDSLWAIATVFSNSDPGGPEGFLDGVIQTIPLRARTQLRKVAEQVVSRDWRLTGEFRKKGLGTHGVALNARSARFLAEQLSVRDVQRRQWTTTGVISGHRWDRGIMFFSADDRARTFAASFESSDLEKTVANLATVEDRRVEARFEVYTAIGKGSEEGTRSYVLAAVRPIAEDTPLDLSADLR